MQMYSMMLAMMEVASNITPPSSKGVDITSLNKKEGNTQQNKPTNSESLEKPSSITATVTSMIASLISLFSLFMVMSMMTAITRPPKKKPPTTDTEVRPSALEELIKKSKEHQRELEAERSKAKPELADEHEASDDEEEEEKDTTEDEELEEEAEK